MLCETYPFRVGLIDSLLAEFRGVFWVHPIYFFLSLFLGIYRIVAIQPLAGNRGKSWRANNGMWDTRGRRVP